MECVTLDLFEYALALAPKLAPLLIGGCDSDSDTSQEELDSLEVLTSKELRPLYRMLRTLFCLVDNRVYIQQCTGRAEVGYETFYENKFVQMEDLLSFDS